MDKVLIAKDGYTYTDGETFGKVVYLGKNDSASNWHEITDEEAQAMMDADIGGESDG